MHIKINVCFFNNVTFIQLYQLMKHAFTLLIIQGTVTPSVVNEPAFKLTKNV